MKKTNKFGVFLVVFGILFIISALSFLSKHDYTTVIVGVLFGLLLVLIGVRRTKKIPASKEVIKSEPAAPRKKTQPKTREDQTIQFKVAGVTFKNDDGTDRQKIIKSLAAESRDILDKKDLYDGMSNKDIIDIYAGDYHSYIYELTDECFHVELKEYDYKGSPAFYVVSQNGIIGNVPADMVNTVKDLLEKSTKQHILGFFTGGKAKYLEYDYDKNKDVVRTETLTYGVRVKAIFSFK